MEQSKEPALQLVAPSYYLLQKKLDASITPRETSAAGVFRAKLKKYLDEKYWSSIKALHWMATFLDPSFKTMAFLPQIKAADVSFKRNLLGDLDNWILAEMRTVAHNSATTASDQTLDNVVAENAPVCKAPKLDADPFADMRDGAAPNVGQQNSDQSAGDELAKYKASRISATNKNPLIFWRDCAGEYPLLSQTARRVYCISASSAQSERDFSSVGHTITDVRSMISAKRVEAIELVKSAMSAGLI